MNEAEFTLAQWSRGAYLLLGDLWLCLSLDKKTKQRPNDEYTHIALNVSEDDYDDVAQKIIAAGTTLWKENVSEGVSLYFLDPDFNKLELHASTLKNRLAHMSENPYEGTELNEELIEQLLK